MIHLNNKKKLFDLVAQGAAVITPNNRLSQALLGDYLLHCHQKTLLKPLCLPYRSFVTTLYQQLVFDAFKANSGHQHHGAALPHPLSQTQCQFLWQQIIKTHPEINYNTGLLQAVMEAWEYCEYWHIRPEDPMFQYTPQTRQFQHWWTVFNQKSKELNTLSEHQLIPYLLTMDEGKRLKQAIKQQTIIWGCFDDFNPQQKVLQQYFNEWGLEQYQYDLKEHNNLPHVLAAKDSKEEYEQLITWLQLKLSQGESRIAVVIPELQHESRYVQRIIQKHFAPDLVNLSLGQGLNEFPLVAHALVWLNLNKTLDYSESALLLQSPYLGFAKAELTERSHYLQDSPLLQKKSISLAYLSNNLESYAPKLAELLKSITPYPKKASIDEWITLFQERLNSLGFPGDHGLSSENYQCLNRFKAIFDEFRQLNLISSELTMHDALSSFAQITQNTIFQAQKTNAPIQISGLLEASGCEFSSLWVMGLTNHSLPKKTRLSAFIPPQLQRELAMPHSSPQRELHFAQQILQRLQRGSEGEIIFSYARMQGEIPSLACPLISEFPHRPLLPLKEKTHSSELIEQEEAYQVPLHEQEQLSGGSALLGNQAKCPFKAFAEHRLNAKALPEHSEGLDNMMKGKIIHRVMELLWQKLQTQEHLIKLSPKQLDQAHRPGD